MNKDEMVGTLNQYCYDQASCKQCALRLHPTCCDDMSLDFEDFDEDVLKSALDTIGYKTDDSINHPDHYCHGGMECIDEMELIFGREAVMHFCLLNAWKYRKRALFKNGEEDIAKSDWYLAKYKELDDERTKRSITASF